MSTNDCHNNGDLPSVPCTTQTITETEGAMVELFERYEVFSKPSCTNNILITKGTCRERYSAEHVALLTYFLTKHLPSLLSPWWVL